jgi:exonuclease SbcC
MKSIAEEIQAGRQRVATFLEAAGAQSEEQLRERRDVAQQRLEGLASQIEAARLAEITAQEQLETAKSTAEKLAELASAQTGFSRVKLSEPETEQARLKLASARRAEQLLDRERFAVDRANEHNDAKSKMLQLAELRSKADQLEKTTREHLIAEESRSQQRATANSEVHRLQELQDRVEKIAAATTDFDAATTEHNNDAAQFKQLETKSNELTQRLEQRDQQIGSLRDTAQKTEFLTLNVQKLNNLVQNRRRLDEANTESGNARKKLDQAISLLGKTTESMQEMRQTFDRMQSEWIAGQAAILAGGLLAGDPCPVCGSASHPNPANSSAPLPNTDELKTLQSRIRQLEADIEPMRARTAEAQADVTRLETEVTGIVNQLGESATLAISALALQLDKAQIQLRESQTASREMSVAVKEQERENAQLTEISGKLVDAQSRLQGSSNRLAAARTALTERQAGVTENLRTPEALGTAIRSAHTFLESLNNAYETVRAECESASRESARSATAHDAAVAAELLARERATTAQTDFAKSLTLAGFPNVEEFSKVKVAISLIASMEETIRVFESELAAAESRLSRAMEAARDLQSPDLLAIEQVLSRARETATALLKEQSQQSEIAKSADRSLEQLKETGEKLQELEASHAVYGKIAGVAGGDNQLHITFQRFVQGALFEDVLQAASERLRRMSKGRFELQRALRAADGRQSGGLDIIVMDSHTGTSRPVSSLSGGEGFMASLSLALGLADVVQSHAGGVRLDSLFIDEGFGSLDPEALDQALQVLTDLRQSGRSIGIISHVTELKERISTRIEVIPQARGSIARIVGGMPSAPVN